MRNIAIIGASILPENLPEFDESWEVWSCNNLYRQFPDVKFTRWYELHKFERKNNRYIRRGQEEYGSRSIYQYMKEMDALKVPVIMQKPWKIIKWSESFPFRNIIARYGSYFGCSFSWLIADALHEHESHQKIFGPVGTIALYGIGLTGKEYYYQRPSTEYMIGLARGKGITVDIDETSRLLKSSYIYAYEEDYKLIETIHLTYMETIANIAATATSQWLEEAYYYENAASGARGK